MSRLRVALVLVLVATSALAGCTSGQADILLRESIEVGQRLYSWGDEDFSRNNPGGEKKISAEFTVPPGIEAIGVSFTGQFVEDDSTATLSATDRDGRPLFVLNATQGSSDDLGEIHTFWKFQRSYAAPLGTYDLQLAGQGWIGPVDFRIHGIEERETSVDRSFEVAKAGKAYEVRVLLDGWGRAPAATLTGPDNTTAPILLDGPEAQATLHIEPPQGAHRIVMDTTGFAGRVYLNVAER